jgi:hypothetical protein
VKIKENFEAQIKQFNQKFLQIGKKSEKSAG